MVGLLARGAVVRLIDMNTYRDRGVVRLHLLSGCCGAESRWRAAEAAKVAMPKDPLWQSLTAQQLAERLPIRVISLASAEERRAAMADQLKRSGLMQYAELVDAADVHNTSAQDVSRYIQGGRLREFVAGGPGSYAARKAAADVSHYGLLERIAQEGGLGAVVVEDDARLPSPNTTAAGWYGQLLEALRDLPQDWDVLYLNACYEKVGRPLGRVAVLTTGVCLLGYLATPSFARRVLAELAAANRRGRGPVSDLFIDDLIHHLEINAYICQPPLLHFSDLPSIIGGQ